MYAAWTHNLAVSDCGLPQDSESSEYAGPVLGNQSTVYLSTSTYRCKPGYELGPSLSTLENRIGFISLAQNVQLAVDAELSFANDAEGDKRDDKVEEPQTTVVLVEGRVAVTCNKLAQWEIIPLCQKKGE